MSGTNYIGHRSAYIPLRIDEQRELLAQKYGEDSMALLLTLRGAHDARTGEGEGISVACKAMAKKQVIGGWRDWRRYDRALKELQWLGYLFAFENPTVAAMGEKSPLNGQ